MTKILPNQDDYAGQDIENILTSPDLSMAEKREYLQTPFCQDIANRLGSEVGINGDAPHMMEKWTGMLDDQESGIQDVKASVAKPKRDVASMFMVNEADEVGAKVVQMQPKLQSKLAS